MTVSTKCLISFTTKEIQKDKMIFKLKSVKNMMTEKEIIAHRLSSVKDREDKIESLVEFLKKQITNQNILLEVEKRQEEIKVKSLEIDVWDKVLKLKT